MSILIYGMAFRPTILLVEDNHDHLRLTKRILERSGLSATISVARNGQEAVDILTARNVRARPNLVLLDLNLPKISGREVLKIIKADPQLASVPVVIVSSSDAQEDVALAARLGAAGYISKSGGFEQLSRELGALRRFLEAPHDA
ncbi:MAG TPA: response regulator [Bacteroidota bacterium]